MKKKDEPIGDLFTVYNAAMATAKTNADKMRAMADMLTATVERTDLTDRAHLIQLCYLAGAAGAQLRMAASAVEREVA